MTNSKKMNPQKLKDMLLKYALYIILLLLLVVIVAIKPNFLSVGNLISILKQASTKGILAYGVAGIIILAGTDLSVGRVLGLCAAVAASMLQSVTFASRYYPSITEPLPLILPFLVCVAIAVIISAFNGFGMAKLHMHPFIVTLGTQLISYGLCCIYIENQPSGSTQALSSLDARYVGLATGSIDIFGFKLPYLVIIFLLLGVVTWIVWNKTRFGKNMFAVGGNSEAAEVSGVSVTKTIMGVFLYAGLMYGIASFLEGARIQSVGTATGINYELDAIAGCVIGGVSFNGGIGTVPGFLIPQVQFCLHPLPDLLPRFLGQRRGHLLGLVRRILGPQTVVVGHELPLQLAQHTGGLPGEPSVHRRSCHHGFLCGDLLVGVLAHIGQRALDAGAVQAVDNVFHCDITGKAPQLRLPAAFQPQMPEYAVEYGVQIQPVEIFWVVLIEPQQVAGLIKQGLTVRSQHPAALVRGGGQGTERHIQKAEVQIQPAAHHRQHLAAHACLPLLVGLRPLGLERLARVKKFFFLDRLGQKCHLT